MVKERLKRVSVFLLTLCMLICMLPSSVFADYNTYLYTNSGKVSVIPSYSGCNSSKLTFKFGVSSNIDDYYTISESGDDYCLNNTIRKYFYDDGISVDGVGCADEHPYWCECEADGCLSDEIENILKVFYAIDAIQKGLIEPELKYEVNSSDDINIVCTVPYFDYENEYGSNNQIKQDFLNFFAYENLYRNEGILNPSPHGTCNVVPSSLSEIRTVPYRDSENVSRTFSVNIDGNTNNTIGLQAKLGGTLNKFSPHCFHSYLMLSVDSQVLYNTIFSDISIDTSNIYYTEYGDEYNINTLDENGDGLADISISNLEYIVRDDNDNFPLTDCLHQPNSNGILGVNFDIQFTNPKFTYPYRQFYDFVYFRYDTTSNKFKLYIDKDKLTNPYSYDYSNIDLSYAKYFPYSNSDYLQKGSRLDCSKTYVISNIKVDDNSIEKAGLTGSITDISNNGTINYYVNNSLYTQGDWNYYDNESSGIYSIFNNLFYHEADCIVKDIEVISNSLNIYLLTDSYIGKVIFKDYYARDEIEQSSVGNVNIPNGYTYWVDKDNNLVDESTILNADEGSEFYGVVSNYNIPCKDLSTGTVLGTVVANIDESSVVIDNNKFVSVEYTTPDMTTASVGGTVYKVCFDSLGNIITVTNVKYNDYLVVSNNESLISCIDKECNITVAKDTIPSWCTLRDTKNYYGTSFSKNDVKKFRLDLSKLAYNSSWSYSLGINYNSYKILNLYFGYDTFKILYIKNINGDMCEIHNEANDIIYVKDYNNDIIYNTKDDINELLRDKFNFVDIDFDNMIITFDFTSFDKLDIDMSYSLSNFTKDYISFLGKAGSTLGAPIKGVGHLFDGVNKTDITSSIHNQTELDALIDGAENKSELVGISYDNVLKVEKELCQRDSSVCITPRPYHLYVQLNTPKLTIENYFDKTDKTEIDISSEHPSIIESDLPSKYSKFYNENLEEINPIDLTVDRPIKVYGIPKESTVTFKSGLDGSVLDTQTVDLVSSEKVGNKLDVKYEPITDLTTREFNGKSYKYWTEPINEIVSSEEDMVWKYFDNTTTVGYNQELYCLVQDKNIDPHCEDDVAISYSAPYLSAEYMSPMSEHYFKATTKSTETTLYDDAYTLQYPKTSIGGISGNRDLNEVVYVKLPYLDNYEDLENFEGFHASTRGGNISEAGQCPISDVILGASRVWDESSNEYKIHFESMLDEGSDWLDEDHIKRIKFSHDYSLDEWHNKLDNNPYSKIIDNNIYQDIQPIIFGTWISTDFKPNSDGGSGDVGYKYNYATKTIREYFNNDSLYHYVDGKYLNYDDLDSLGLNNDKWTARFRDSRDSDWNYYCSGITFNNGIHDIGVLRDKVYLKLPDIEDVTGGMMSDTCLNFEGTYSPLLSTAPSPSSNITIQHFPGAPFWCVTGYGYIYVNSYEELIDKLIEYGDIIKDTESNLYYIARCKYDSYDTNKYRFGMKLGNFTPYKIDGVDKVTQQGGSTFPWYNFIYYTKKSVPRIKSDTLEHIGHDFTNQDYTTIPKPTEQSELNALALGAKNYDTSWDLDLSKIKEVKKQLCARADDICTTPHAYNLQIVYYGANTPIVENTNTSTQVVDGDTIEGDLPLKIYDEDKDIVKVTIDGVDYTPDENNEVIKTIVADNQNHTIYAKDDSGHEVTVTVKVNMPNKPTIVKTDDSTIGTVVTGDLEFKASDIDDDLEKVTVDGVDHTPDTNNEVIKTIVADDQMHTIKAVDEVGHETIVTVTVNTIALPQNAPDVIDKSTGLAVSNNGIYVGDLQIKVTDIDMDLAEVTVDGVSIPIDSVSNSAETTIVANNLAHEIIAKDAQGNTKTLTVIVKTLDSFNITVRGFLNSIDNQPIANAKIQLHSTPRIVTTDENGYYEFDDVELDNHTLKASVGTDEVYSMSINLTKTQVKAQVTNISNTFTLSSSSEINNDSIVFTVNAKECDNHIHTHKIGDELSATCTTDGYVTDIDYCPTCLMEWSRVTTVKPALGHIWVDDWVKLDTVTNDIILGAENRIVWNGTDDVYRRYCNRARDAYELKTVASTPNPTPTPTPEPTPTPNPTPTPIPTPNPTPTNKYVVTVMDKYGDADAVERCKDSYSKGDYYSYSAIEKDGYVVYGNNIQEGIVTEDITLTFIYKKDIDEGNKEGIDTTPIEEDTEEIETLPSLNKVMIKVYDKYDGIKSLRKIYKVDFNTKYSYKAKPRNNYMVVGDSVISGIADEDVIEIVFEYEPFIKDIDEDTNIDDIKDEDIIDDGKSKTGDNGIIVLLLGIILMMLSRRLRRKK